MATFYNQASLSYGGGTVNSNVTEAELLSGLELTKSAVNGTYAPGGSIVYTVNLVNAGTASYNALTLSDNLGAYVPEGGGTAVPLNYIDGSLLYYLNGALQPTPTVSTDNGLEISGINLPGGSSATFVYATRANEFAPLAAGGVITNTVTTDGGVGIGELSASATVSVEEAPRLTIAKAVCPAVLSDNGQLTYTLIVQNLGNTEIVATDDVIISDVFNPILSNISVTLNGTALEEGTGYTYNETTGEFATANGTVTVPAATYTVLPGTGAVTTTPGVTVLTVTGTV